MRSVILAILLSCFLSGCSDPEPNTLSGTIDPGVAGSLTLPGRNITVSWGNSVSSAVQITLTEVAANALVLELPAEVQEAGNGLFALGFSIDVIGEEPVTLTVTLSEEDAASLGVSGGSILVALVDGTVVTFPVVTAISESGEKSYEFTLVAGGSSTAIRGAVGVGSSAVARRQTVLVRKAEKVTFEAKNVPDQAEVGAEFVVNVTASVGTDADIAAAGIEIPGIDLSVSPVVAEKKQLESSDFAISRNSDGTEVDSANLKYSCSSEGEGSFGILVKSAYHPTGLFDRFMKVLFRSDRYTPLPVQARLTKPVRCVQAAVACETGKVESAGNCVCDSGTVANNSGGCEESIGDFSSAANATLTENGTVNAGDLCQIGSLGGGGHYVTSIPGFNIPNIKIGGITYLLDPGEVNQASADNCQATVDKDATPITVDVVCGACPQGGCAHSNCSTRFEK